MRALNTRIAIVFVISSCLASSAIADAIHDAAAKGDIQAVRKLIEANPQLVKSVDNTWLQTPLHFAARYGKRAAVVYLLANQADIEGWGARSTTPWTPLLLAARSGNTDVALLLLAKGANADVKLPSNDCVDATPLYFAVCNLDKVLVDKLITWKVDVNELTHEGVPAIFACFNYQSAKREAAVRSILNTLIAAGAKLDITTPRGNTLLHCAVERGLVAVAQNLIDQKVDVNAKNMDGQTPFAIASSKGDKILMELLKRHGGTE